MCPLPHEARQYTCSVEQRPAQEGTQGCQRNISQPPLVGYLILTPPAHPLFVENTMFRYLRNCFGKHFPLASLARKFFTPSPLTPTAKYYRVVMTALLTQCMRVPHWLRPLTLHRYLLVWLQNQGSFLLWHKLWRVGKRTCEWAEERERQLRRHRRPSRAHRELWEADREDSAHATACKPNTLHELPILLQRRRQHWVAASGTLEGTFRECLKYF